MVAGHLREKSGYYYAVLNYTDSLGKRKTKWISTGLAVKGNKKRAEAILMDARRNFNPEEPKVMNGDILFADYMEKWSTSSKARLQSRHSLHTRLRLRKSYRRTSAKEK